MSDPRKIYWDSSCFICFLNADENQRSHICDDILKHAEAGSVEIWISTWVIVEVIRPRRPGNTPLPEWANKAIKAVPESRGPLEDLWRRFQRNNPSPKLTAAEIQKIQAMFEWPFLKKAEVDERIALKAIELCRDFGMRPSDAIHAATAILWQCDVIQRWDKDFSKVAHLISSEEPTRLSAQSELLQYNRYGPNAGDFAPARQAQEPQAIANPAEVLGTGSGHPESRAARKTEEVRPSEKEK